MIMTQTPFRISFAGGGSDLKEFYLEHGGSVLSTSIDKFTYLSMHPLFNKKKYFLKYSVNEWVKKVGKIQHNIIREVFKTYKIKGVDFNSSSDIPSGTGLGSSSTFTAGLITLCNAYNGIYMNQEDVAKEASRIEIEVLKEPIGKQDQYAAACGGLNFIKFNQDESVAIEKIMMKPSKKRELQDNLLMFYLGETRSAKSILSEQRKNTLNNQDKINNLKRMVQLSEELKVELSHSNIDSMGDNLHRGWEYKKELASKVSNEKIDHYYNLAMKNGATGGKLLGAGGSGFLLFYVPKTERAKLRKALTDLKEFKFKFENEGSRVVYFNA